MTERILAAVDGSVNAERAVKAAADFANAFGAKLFLVHVIGSGAISPSLARLAEVEHLTEPKRAPQPGNVANVFGNLATASRTPDSPVVAHEVHRAVGEKVLNKAIGLAREAGTEPADAILKEGEPAVAILEAAKEANVDLVVLGTRGLSELKGLLLGSVSHKVIQVARCACLVVK